MQSPFAYACMLHGREQHGMREELAVLDHQVDARDVHVHDAAGTDVEMPDLAVAHLPLGQADERSTCVNQRVGILAQQAVVSGLACQSDGVGLGFGAVSPAVENDQDEGFGSRHSSPWSRRGTDKSWQRIYRDRQSFSNSRLVSGSPSHQVGAKMANNPRAPAAGSKVLTPKEFPDDCGIAPLLRPVLPPNIRKSCPVCAKVRRAESANRHYGVIVNVSVPEEFGISTDVAVMVTEFGLGGVAGAL